MADFDWSSLISPILGAYGSYRNANQLGNATNQAAQMSDPYSQYRGAAGQAFNSLTSQPVGQRVAGLQGGQWGNALSQYEGQTPQQRYGSYTQGPWSQQLNSLQSNPSSVSSMPGYQFAFDQGLQGINRNAASRGLLDSGATGKALTRYGQDYASTQFNNERNFLAGQSNNEIAGQMGLGNTQQSTLGTMAGQEASIGGQFSLANQNALTQASGANLNPAVAAMLQLQGREGQLGLYNQGLGGLLNGLGIGGQSGQGGALGALSQGGAQSPLSQLMNSGVNAIKNYFTGGSPSNGLVSGYPAAGQGYTLPGNSPGIGDYGYGGDTGYGDLMNYGGDQAFDAGIEAYPYTDYGSSFGAGSSGAATGLGASAADGSTAYNALSSAAEGAEGGAAAGGASSLAGYALPAAAVLYGINAWNQGGETNNAVVGTTINDVGGVDAFKKLIEQQIQISTDPALRSQIDKTYADMLAGVSSEQAPPEDGSNWSSLHNAFYTPQDMTIDPSDFQRQFAISNHGAQTPSAPANGLLSLFSGKYDTEMNQILGPAVYEDLRKRLGTSAQAWGDYSAEKLKMLTDFKNKAMSSYYTGTGG